MKIIGIITARGGSKRVPRKNVRAFLGKPLLAWSVEAGLKSKTIKRWILSTDDSEIAEIGRKYGAEVPFMRPKELAFDTSTSLDVLQHAVLWLKEKEKKIPDWMVLLEPPSPGRQPFHIDEVASIIEEKNNEIDSICGVSELLGNLSAHKSLKIKSDKTLVRYYDDAPFRSLIFRNQDVPPSYFINSAIYAFKVSKMLSNPPSLWGDRVRAYVMDSKYAIDIDTPEDWIVGEAKMKELLR